MAPPEYADSKILVVDDMPANVMLLEKTLARAGYDNVRSTTNPLEVLPMHEEHGFDLFLLDIRMPELDGFGVMQQLKDAMSDDYVPVIVLTAQTDSETRMKALQMGAKDFLTKPFDTVEVVHRIHNTLEVRQLYNARRRQNEILEVKVRERTADLRNTQLEIIKRLGRAGEYRDNETGMHVVRVGHMCRLMARSSGIEEAHAEVIMHASTLHDLGKIGIPDNILLKPGRLEPDEWNVMVTHVEIGADILKGESSDLLRTAHKIALTHHERWDGKGYPNNVSGEAIPIEGRIVAICDVFDALMSWRPYKDPWPEADALALIEKEAGQHFDPKLAELFLANIDEIRKIRADFADEEEG